MAPKRTRKGRRVTLAEIATIAGVAPSTVSKVLNGGWDVSSATRERVQALLAEHQYVRRGSSAASPPVIDLVSRSWSAHGPWRSWAGL